MLCIARRRGFVYVAILSAIALLAGCGAKSQTSQVRSKVMQLATAVSHHDFQTICTQVLAPQLIEDLVTKAGLSCQQAMKLSGWGTLQDPRMVMDSRISVRGDRASVPTITQAKGQKTTAATLVLTKTSAGWRVSSLAG
ncbi:MAG: hypothetical protein J2O48_01390 [Solirubrobacterales bacterium]|nr:hypothetical protein [Solirubrobacterales bacterium]